MDAERVWQRIVACAGQEFRQILGKPFTYEVRGPRTLKLHTTNRNVSRMAIERGLARWPVDRPRGLSGINASSYVYALLADERVCGRSGAS